MALIGLAGFLHETNTFERGTTPLARFIEADAWPGWITGPEVLDATRGMNLAISGFVEAAQESGHRFAPLSWCSANPSGPVAQDAYDTIVADLEDRLARHPGLDALFLDLHGAMVTEKLDDGEGELLRRLRRLRPNLPIVAALDFHANLSEAMVSNSDALVAYRSYPHVDMADTGKRAAVMLDRILSGKTVHHACRRLPFLVPMPWQSTLAEPAATLMAAATALQDDTTWEVQFIPGFPLADIPECGPSVLVYAEDSRAAEEAADALAGRVASAKAEFGGVLHGVTQAVDHAMLRQHQAGRESDAAPSARQGALILADTQDNPGGGGSGDTTDLLHELLRRDVEHACAGVLCDAEFAARAHAAGIGAMVSGPLGGHSGIGAPSLEGHFEVLGLGDGRFTGTGPFYSGCHMELGPMARVRMKGLEVVVSSRKQQAADRAMFRHVGADPERYRLLVLKSSVHFRADFGPLADEILVVAAPGVNTADLHALPYTRLRAGVELL